MPDDLLSILTTKLKLDTSQVQPGGRYHNAETPDEFSLIDKSLEYNPSSVTTPPRYTAFQQYIRVIEKQDIFLNFPYHTFDHVIDFLREAAIDPKVTRICITLYRTAQRSKIINVLDKCG